MRAALFALMAVGALSAIDIAPAQAGDYPFCMRTRYGSDDCSYYNYRQCAVTANGLGTTCFANPALAFNRQFDAEQPAPRRRHRQYRAY